MTAQRALWDCKLPLLPQLFCAHTPPCCLALFPATAWRRLKARRKQGDPFLTHRAQIEAPLLQTMAP